MHLRTPRALAAVRPVTAALALSLVALACSGVDSTTSRGASPDAAPPSTAAAVAARDASCHPEPLEQRAARVLVVGLPGVTVSSHPMVQEVLDVGVGGVLLTRPNVESTAQVGQLVSDLRALAGRPLVVSTGEESGRVSTFRHVFKTSPSAREVAARNTPEEAQATAAELGSKLAAIGIDLDLAPVVDLDTGPANGAIGDRSFSGDPATASAYGLAWAEGLASAGIRPTAKHFPGHGRVLDDTHLGLPTVDATLEELMATDLQPFAKLIDAGVPLVMLDHIAYTALDPGLPASLAPKAYQLLRDMGFEGVAITDSVGMGAVNLHWSFPEAAVMAVAAGADAVLTTDGSQAREMRDALVQAVHSGRLPEARLDLAAGRMTALAGGDPAAAVCTDVRLPDMVGVGGG